MKKLKLVLFMLTAALLLNVQRCCGQSFYTVVKNQIISDTALSGTTTDTLFVLDAKYEFASFQAFGNTGEYCTIRTYTAGGTEAGNFRLYSGQIINYPNPPNLISILPNFDIDLGTLSTWSGNHPLVYCIAWTK